MLKISKILCPTDFSEHSRAAVPYALDLAGKFQAELHVVHVIDEAYQYWTAVGDGAVPVVFSENELLDAAQKQMDEFIANHLKNAAVPLVTRLLIGRPFLEIIRYADQEEMDLIVMGTHGRGALAAMLLGSVTERVVRKSPCPVLTVRHPEHKFEMP